MLTEPGIFRRIDTMSAGMTLDDVTVTPAEVAAAGRFVDKHCPDNHLIRAMLGIGGDG